MSTELTPHLVDLVYEAALKSFWRHSALRKFLREMKISEPFLSSWSKPETKRQFLDRLFERLQRSDKGREAILRMANALIDQRSFPDLKHWEESQEMIREARTAVQNLRAYLVIREEEQEEERRRKEAKKELRDRQREAQKTKLSLQKLEARLSELSQKLGTQNAGYEFEQWFFELAQFDEIVARRPYRASGRQIDGSVTVSGTTYLVEAKFRTEPVDPSAVDSIKSKVLSKADNTMGVLVSMSGFTDGAVEEASGPKTHLLLLDYRHLFLVLRGQLRLHELVNRVRRHASQTGESYLDVEDL